MEKKSFTTPSIDIGSAKSFICSLATEPTGMYEYEPSIYLLAFHFDLE